LGTFKQAFISNRSPGLQRALRVIAQGMNGCVSKEVPLLSFYSFNFVEAQNSGSNCSHPWKENIGKKKWGYVKEKGKED
jgi:hypothetical protein